METYVYASVPGGLLVSKARRCFCVTPAVGGAILEVSKVIKFEVDVTGMTGQACVTSACFGQQGTLQSAGADETKYALTGNAAKWAPEAMGEVNADQWMSSTSC